MRLGVGRTGRMHVSYTYAAPPSTIESKAMIPLTTTTLDPIRRKLLVTGGAGFIGAAISRRLAELGYEVVIFDGCDHLPARPQPGHQHYLDLRYAPLREAEIIRGDLRDASQIKESILKHRPEIVIHLAAIAVATTANKDSRAAIEHTMLGTANLLEAVKEAGCVKRVVYCSSSMVYGDFQQTPCPEDHPLNPKEIYGGTKLTGEILTRVYGQRFGFEHVVIRPSAVYGPTDVNGRIVQLFIERAMQGQELVLHGGGSDRLDFSYISDVAEGFVLAALHPAAAGETFNITRGEGRSLLELAEILRQHFPNLKTVVGEADVKRPTRGALDISKARRLLGYEPRYSLEQGVAEYVRFVRDHSL